MELFVVRHAKAAEAEPGQLDASRPLTTGGTRRFQAVVSGLGELGVQLDVVVHSPWLRAAQTAELLSELCRGALRVDELLARPPQRGLFSLLAELEETGAETVALVGHQPWLGEFVAWAVTGAVNTASNFPLKKGAVVCLRGTPRPGGLSLDAALPPAVLSALG